MCIRDSYSPYQVEDGEYSYTFEWVSDLAIDQVTTIVQQPAAARDLSLIHISEPTRPY